MCRFCACKLAREELSEKCAYKKNNKNYNVLWVPNNCINYEPSEMLQARAAGLPVLVDGKHFESLENRIFCPMLWGLIPSWHKGEVKEWKPSTHNARIENLNESKVYSTSLSEGKRCIIVMEGFFEFKKNGSKPAEVFYLQSADSNLLKAAGLFGTFKKENGEILHSCSMITTESKSNVKNVHHRTPVLLFDDADIEAWLDFKNISSSDAVSKIKSKPQSDLKFYKTTKIGSREPVNAKKALASQSMMLNWLNAGAGKGQKRKAED